MIQYHELGPGICADVTFGLDGNLYVIAQHLGLSTISAVLEGGEVWSDFAPVPFHAPDACYPRFIDRQYGIAYRVGGLGFLWRHDAPVVALGPCGGIFPFAGSIDSKWVGYRATSGNTRVLDYNTLALHSVEHRQTVDGLASVTEIGTPIYRMDTRGVEQPHGTFPDYDKTYVVTESPTSGALVRDKSTGKSVTLWPGHDAKTPMLSVSPITGALAVVTVEPLRLATFSPADLTLQPAPLIMPPDLKHAKIWAGLYKTQTQTAVAPAPPYAPWVTLPGNCELDPEVSKDTSEKPLFARTVRVALLGPLMPDRCAGLYCESQGTWEQILLGLHSQHVEARRVFEKLPTFGVLDGFHIQPMPKDARLPDVPVYECYLRGEESVPQMISRMTAIVARDTHSAVGLVVQMYRGPGNATPDELAQCVCETARIAVKYPKVRCLWGFAANRANGLRDQAVYDAVMPAWTAIVGTITTPSIVRLS